MQITVDLTKKYALAVSGGADSMAMLHCFASLSPRPNFFVVTVNHQIRKEAQSDCDFVADYCQKLGVECRTFCVDAPSYSEKNKISLETAARILRYRVFAALDCDIVCLAHHASDNAETVLMHIIRGSGAEGACGIRKISGKYCRPLIDVTKEQIENYVKQNNVPFVTDCTNDDLHYRRNYVRHEIMPRLKQIVPGVEQNIERFAQNIAADNDYLNALADDSSVVTRGKTAKIPCDLLKLPAPISYRILKKTFAKLGIFYDVESVHLADICNLANKSGGKSINLPFDYVAINDYDMVSIEPQNTYDCEPFCFEPASHVQTPFGTVTISKQKTENCLTIDFGKLPQNAVIRSFEQGDVFTKFGGGTKPLNRYFIDKKIPERKRKTIPVIAAGNTVLVICGVEIADSLRTDENSDVRYVTFLPNK